MTNHSEQMWRKAIADVQDRIEKLDRERRRLVRAGFLLKRQLRDGVEWPVPEPVVLEQV